VASPAIALKRGGELLRLGVGTDPFKCRGEVGSEALRGLGSIRRIHGGQRLESRLALVGGERSLGHGARRGVGLFGLFSVRRSIHAGHYHS